MSHQNNCHGLMNFTLLPKTSATQTMVHVPVPVRKQLITGTRLVRKYACSKILHCLEHVSHSEQSIFLA